MMTALVAEMVTGNRDLSEWAFLIAVIAALLSAVGAFGTNQLTKHSGWLLSLAVALAAFGWFVL